jgi:hypothetical protein
MSRRDPETIFRRRRLALVRVEEGGEESEVA